MSLEELKEFRQKLEAGEIMTMDQVRKYKGIFTGKTVKPHPDTDPETLKEFQKGDTVYILHGDDMELYYQGCDQVLEVMRKDRQERDQGKY